MDHKTRKASVLIDEALMTKVRGIRSHDELDKGRALLKELDESRMRLRMLLDRMDTVEQALEGVCSEYEKDAS